MRSEPLFILTKKFPFGHQEAYLFSELEVLKKKFEKIVIIPHDEFDYTDEKNRVKGDNQIEIVKINKLLKRTSLPVKIKAIALAKKWYKVDLQKRLRKDEVAAHKAQYQIQMKHAFAQAEALKDFFQAKYPQLTKITLYNYWMHRGVLLSARFKEITTGKQVRIVTRAHSYDIYHDHWFEMFKEANPKFLPFLYFKLNACEKIYTISDHGKRFMKKEYGVQEEKLEVERLGVSDYSGSEERKRSTEADLVFMTCSWITNLKRMYLIPEILSKLNKKVKWIHFGSGGEENMKRLNDEISKYGLEENCEVKGKVDHQVIIQFYKHNHVDLFLNLSTVEGIPVALMEAACFETPMVATDTVGNPEIVNADNGFVIPIEFEAKELAEQLNAFFDDSERVKEKRAVARKTFESNYHAEKNYINFADKLINLS